MASADAKRMEFAVKKSLLLKVKEKLRCHHCKTPKNPVNQFETKIIEKTRQKTQSKQTFDLSRKIEIDGKTRQNAENKQSFDLTGKIEIDEITRQNTENKQTFGLT